MNRIRRTRPARRLAALLAGLAGTILAAPAAFARSAPPAGIPAVPAPAGPAPVPAHLPPLPPGWNKHPPLGHVVGPVYKVPVHSAVGMPGWQIILIAAGAAVLAVMVVLAARARTARRHRAAPST